MMETFKLFKSMTRMLLSIPRILIVGGAGYIGSHMVKMLARLGCHAITLLELAEVWVIPHFKPCQLSLDTVK
jgi:tRNA A37 threonylcarbamoyladenosine dehydratase